MGTLQAQIVGLQNREPLLRASFQGVVLGEKSRSFRLNQIELLACGYRIGMVEAVRRKLLLLGEAHLTVRHRIRPAHVEDVVYTLQIRGDAVEPVRQLNGDWIEINSPALLKICELRDLETVEQNLPADSPRAERGRLPVVFFKSNVVFL